MKVNLLNQHGVLHIQCSLSNYKNISPKADTNLTMLRLIIGVDKDPRNTSNETLRIFSLSIQFVVEQTIL